MHEAPASNSLEKQTQGNENALERHLKIEVYYRENVPQNSALMNALKLLGTILLFRIPVSGKH